jgi:hypothetical protein
VDGSLERALQLPDGPKKTAAVAAWIQSLYDSEPPILVGGAAVELYTGGAYTTGDLDFVGRVTPEVSRELEKNGFRREGRHWIHDESKLFVEFPGSVIEPNAKVARIEVGGTQVLTLSPEDMIVDRLAAWELWNSTTDGASAFLIWKAQEAGLDRERLALLAEQRRVNKGYQRLVAFVEDLGDRKCSAEDLERWARQKA